MRLARGYDAVDGNGRPYFSPDRQRLLDPWVRSRLATYLRGGVEVAIGYRTDAHWVWNERIARYALDRRIAPEEPFLNHIEAAGYLPPDSVPDDAITGAKRLITAATRVPAEPPSHEVAYFIRVDDDFPPDAPLSLLRRIPRPDGDPVDQAIWRDLRWHPTNTFTAHERSSEYDLRPVSPERAAEILDQWCAKWATERPNGAVAPTDRASITVQRSNGMTRGGS